MMSLDLHDFWNPGGVQLARDLPYLGPGVFRLPVSGDLSGLVLLEEDGHFTTTGPGLRLTWTLDIGSQRLCSAVGP